MTFREFPVLRPADDEPGPEFGLGDLRFYCVPNLPAGVVAESPLDWPEYDSIESSRERNLWITRAAIFVQRCVIDAQSALLIEALQDKAAVVDGRTLLDIARWLVEEYTPFDPRQLGLSSNGHGPMSLTGAGASSATGGPSPTSD